MGQSEISEALMNNYPEFISGETIEEQTGLNKDNVLRNLRKLKKRPETEIKVIVGGCNWKTLYRMKPNMQLKKG